MRENRMFSEMIKAAKARLEHRDPLEIAKRADVGFDSRRSCFQVVTLGKTVTVGFPDFDVEPALEPWRQLLLLHYLDLADGTPLTGRLISFSQVKDGLIRGGDFDRRCEEVIQNCLGKQPEAALREKCRGLGAAFQNTNADFTAVFPFFPRYPVTLKLWFADEEFDASGRLFLDASSEHYLTIEDAVTAGELLLESLQREL